MFIIKVQFNQHLHVINSLHVERVTIHCIGLQQKGNLIYSEGWILEAMTIGKINVDYDDHEINIRQQTFFRSFSEYYPFFCIWFGDTQL